MNQKDLNELLIIEGFLKRYRVHTGRKAMIAGGAPRNCWLDLPIRDVDIFFEHEEDVMELVKLMSLNITRPPLGMGDMGGPYANAGSVVDEQIKVWKCDWCYGTTSMWNIDLIWVPSITGRIEDFPDYISQCWLHPSGCIMRSANCVKDMQSKYLRYISSRMRTARLTRLQELFPDYTFFNVEDKLEIIPDRKRSGRRAEPDYAPFWWDLPPILPEKAMDITRSLCGGQQRGIWS